jgi:nucleotide-binding universal stress UspA family protein
MTASSGGNVMTTDIKRNRNILIAVDESENAERAVLYVKDLLAGLPGFHITIVTIIQEPPDDYFITESEKKSWIQKQNASAKSILHGYRDIFVQGGFGDADITLYPVMKECDSLAECILDEQRRLSCGTVVIGRRGISKKEEFIYGSTSNKILHISKDCSVWVIE